MKQGTRYGREAVWIAGTVFAVTGALLMIMACIGFSDRAQALTILGPSFFVIGSIFLVFDWNQRRMAHNLMEEGCFVWGEVVSLEYNSLIRVNKRYPWYVKVRYRGEAGQLHTVKSRCISSRTAPSLVGCRVKVYVDSGNRHSYVDLDSMEAK